MNIIDFKNMITPVLNWRWALAMIVFSCGLAGFQSGVEVSERDLVDVNLATKMYYTLGLFILGGLDLGVPVSGPLWGQALLWISYFGAPLLTGSTIVDWVHQVISNQDRWLRNISGHVVLIGADDVAQIILEKLKELNPKTPVVIVDREISSSRARELTERYKSKVLTGDFTNEFFLSTLRLSRAKRVILASKKDFDNFEAASKILDMRPDFGSRIVVHCNRLRFMRMLKSSRVVKNCIAFNSNHLAAQYLVKNDMMAHFKSTGDLDTVVLAGFGRFGQTVLEELLELAQDEICDIGIIDIDAHRRILVAKEQKEISKDINLHVLQSEIGHPEVWQQLERLIDLHEREPLVLIATGVDDENLRTSLWLKKKYPNAKVMVRTARPSHFAESVCQAAGIQVFGLSEIIHDSMPDEWFV
ncbi:MAG: NAD-binding protein [Gammaproteobacteria bacterium]|nr:NAD-binding protein [Gammaproteobacteria bacterium]